MHSSRSAEAIVALEDDSPDVLLETFCGTDLHIWPLLRVPLGRWSADQELGTHSIVKTSTRSTAVKRLLRNRFWPGPHEPQRIRQHRNVLFIAGGGTIQQTAAGRINWLIDEFAETFDGNALVLQDRAINSLVASERPVFEETYSFFDTLPSIDLRARLSPVPKSAMRSALFAINEIVDRFPFPVSDALKQRLNHQAIGAFKRAPHLAREYRRILDRVEPRLVVMDGASYGNRAALTKLLRERGISIMEPQHGWIGPSHAAYNFGRAMSIPELKQYLPDKLMTFGSFWSNEIRHPSTVVPIGKPHLEKLAMCRSQSKRQPSVLVVSSLYRPEQLVALAIALRDHLPSTWQVLIRPHPSERPIAGDRFAALSNEDRIEVDTNTDVYDSFAESSVVIGHASTVLFEALAFRLPVFVIDSPLADLYTPTEVFGERLRVGNTSPKIIASRILSARPDTVSKDMLKQIWQPDAIKNFRHLTSSFKLK